MYQYLIFYVLTLLLLVKLISNGYWNDLFSQCSLTSTLNSQKFGKVNLQSFSLDDKNLKGTVHFSFSFFFFLEKDCLRINRSVRHILAILFCKFKRQLLWNKEKCFVFHFENSLCSWNNQILSDVEMSWHHQMPKYETWNWITCKINTAW